MTIDFPSSSTPVPTIKSIPFTGNASSFIIINHTQWLDIVKCLFTAHWTIHFTATKKKSKEKEDKNAEKSADGLSVLDD